MPNQPIEREALKNHLGKRIVIDGHFSKFMPWTDHANHRDYTCCVLENVSAGGTLVADHVWIHHAEALRSLEPELDLDEEVRLSAVVREYKKRRINSETGKSETITSYYLDRPDDIKYPGRERLALRPANYHQTTNGISSVIPPIPPPRPFKAPCYGTIVPEPKPAAIAPEPTLDYCVLLKDVKALAKRCGGLKRLGELVQLMLED